MSLENVVVIGGTGHFGTRICRRLVGEDNTRLIVTSRDVSRSSKLAEELSAAAPGAAVRAASLDQLSPNFETELLSLQPRVVIHTAGPYQGQDYRVARACIAAGSHYIDLADGRDFVAGICELNQAATERDVLVVAGASTLPGLSSAVVDHLSTGYSTLDTIEISIAPAHQTPRGESTIKAVLSYCGRPFQVLVEGQWQTHYGWQDLTRFRYPNIGSRLGGACDVPDLELMPRYRDEIRTVTFHAALEARWEQLALWLMGWVSRAGIVKDWHSFVPTFQRISDRLIGLGSETGGMHIKLIGETEDDKTGSVTWHLTARRNHGPEIPCSPALILARKLLSGRIDQRGAVPCLGLFTLDEFDREVESLDIDWTIEPQG